jgi:SAM-dependent methyltransferase
MYSKDAIEITLRQMDLWFQSPLGSYLLEVERAELDKLLPYYYGDHFLQIGGPSETFLFESTPILHRVRLSPESSPVFHGPSVRGRAHKIPFLSEIMDVVLLPHVLELSQYHEALLAECYRVLAPEGRLIILGFNPSSLWGLKRLCGGKKTLPWRAHFKFKTTICNLLTEQGFDIEHKSTMLFEPPVKNAQLLKKLFPMEAIGKICWADWGAVYMIVAHKSVVSPIMLETSGTPSL